MTRDEAIRVLVRRAAPCFPDVQEIKLHPLCTAEIDSWVELGMLKLDEPKSQRDRLVEILGRRDWMASDVDEFRECIYEAGLRIVEK